MKLPNGFGTVYKMQGNRRRPYVAKKTIQGKQKAIGYFETFDEAMACLVAYNRDPTLLSPSRTTFSEVYALWKAKHFSQLRSESARVSYRNSYRHCARLHDMIFVDIRRAIFDPVMEHFGMVHTPHECRHTLASMLDSADANRTVIKLILGHSLEGVTECVYTYKSVRELLRAIDRICP